jgi:hypothetical protein
MSVRQILSIMFLSSFTSTEALLVPSKEISLEIGAEKTDGVVMSREQNAGRTRNMKTGVRLLKT